MICFFKQFKQILITTAFLLVAVTAISQVKSKPVASKQSAAKHESKQLTDFRHLTAEANLIFAFPAGFKEIPALNNEDFSYDYAMALPGRDFEIWFQVKSQKKDWQVYELSKNDPARQTANPDSNYNAVGQAQAKTLTGNPNVSTRPVPIPPDVLARYNASAGKVYLLDLQDLDATKHYKYAMLITLEKDRTGTIVAICFANEKGPEFFKNINLASKCLKFKP